MVNIQNPFCLVSQTGGKPSCRGVSLPLDHTWVNVFPSPWAGSPRRGPVPERRPHAEPRIHGTIPESCNARSRARPASLEGIEMRGLISMGTTEADGLPFRAAALDADATDREAVVSHDSWLQQVADLSVPYRNRHPRSVRLKSPCWQRCRKASRAVAQGPLSRMTWPSASASQR